MYPFETRAVKTERIRNAIYRRIGRACRLRRSDRDYRVRRISSSVALAAGAWLKKPASFSHEA